MTHTVNTKEHTDIKRLDWIEKFLPEVFRPYAYLMRLDRPIGVWLLLLPSLWGIALSAGGITSFLMHIDKVILFSIGAVIMRGAGCTVNDLWDRDIDKKVERTKGRPIACGDISVKRAIIFLATLLLMGLVILLQFNVTTIILGFLTIPLIIAYPLMKRITWWPQLFLGITFNFGALMGWSAVSGGLTIAPFMLYFGALAWTIAYDTIYAHQDKEDDILIGVKSTALLFGDKSKHYVTLFFLIAFALIAGAVLLTKGLSLGLIIMAVFGGHLMWQITSWDENNPESSLAIFKSNKIAGLIALLSCII